MNEITAFFTGLNAALGAAVSLVVAILAGWKEFSAILSKSPRMVAKWRIYLLRGVAAWSVLLCIWLTYRAFQPPPPPPPNTPPSISDIADQPIQAGRTVGPLLFTVSDAETTADALVVTAASSNVQLVAASAISLSGSGPNRAIRLAAAAGQSGSTTITVTVTDEGGIAATDTFTVNVASPPPPTREMLLTSAWNASNGEKWDQVVELTTRLLKDFEFPAETKQVELTMQKVSLPKTGVIGADLSDGDVRTNHSFGLISDVATALLLRGEANKQLGKQVEARADWKKVMTFDHAVTFDIQTKEFWRTKEGAENKLRQLDRK